MKRFFFPLFPDDEIPEPPVNFFFESETKVPDASSSSINPYLKWTLIICGVLFFIGTAGAVYTSHPEPFNNAASAVSNSALSIGTGVKDISIIASKFVYNYTAGLYFGPWDGVAEVTSAVVPTVVPALPEVSGIVNGSNSPLADNASYNQYFKGWKDTVDTTASRATASSLSGAPDFSALADDPNWGSPTSSGSITPVASSSTITSSSPREINLLLKSELKKKLIINHNKNKNNKNLIRQFSTSISILNSENNNNNNSNSENNNNNNNNNINKYSLTDLSILSPEDKTKYIAELEKESLNKYNELQKILSQALIDHIKNNSKIMAINKNKGVLITDFEDVLEEHGLHLLLTKELILHLVEYFWKEVMEKLEPNYFVLFLLRVKYVVVIASTDKNEPDQVFYR